MKRIKIQNIVFSDYKKGDIVNLYESLEELKQHKGVYGPNAETYWNIHIKNKKDIHGVIVKPNNHYMIVNDMDKYEILK